MPKPCQAPLCLSSPTSLLPPGGANTPLLSVPVLLLRCAYTINLGLTSVPFLPTADGSQGSSSQPCVTPPPTSLHRVHQIPFQAFSSSSSIHLTSPLLHCSLSSQGPFLPVYPLFQTQALLCSLTLWSALVKPVPTLGTLPGICSPHHFWTPHLLGLTCNWAMGRARHLPSLSQLIVTTDSRAGAVCLCARTLCVRRTSAFLWVWAAPGHPPRL